jgi:hypothetical protein
MNIPKRPSRHHGKSGGRTGDEDALASAEAGDWAKRGITSRSSDERMRDNFM